MREVYWGPGWLWGHTGLLEEDWELWEVQIQGGQGVQTTGCLVGIDSGTTWTGGLGRC